MAARVALPSREDLVEIVYRYYPRGIHPSEAGYQETEAFKRYQPLKEDRRWDRDGRWGRFMELLRQKHPTYRYWDCTFGHGNGCYIVRALLPRAEECPEDIEVVCLVSYLAPVYATYVAYMRGRPPHRNRRIVFTPPDGSEEARAASLLAAEIEAEFDVAPFPPEYRSTIIPDVVAGNEGLGEASLFHCLFTDSIW
jgi:hypothetical protein